MLSQSIDIDNIDEGVDRKLLNKIKDRFLSLNQHRYERTHAALTDRQQHFFTLLPLLFHVNHPLLPGYISQHTPCGLFSYKPEKDALRAAKIMARSFQYKTDLIIKKTAIDALFIMGSVGSIAQSDTSDMDVWVCYAEDLNPAEHKELERKCLLISSWSAQKIHLEVHFFLMRSDDFNHHRQQVLSAEASGSAQHYLLLDEFYRTALWLGGKVPLWWYVPASQERNYQEYTQKLLTKRFIKENDVIDFGGLPEIPANEFVGAGIWQLYKAIESPYKSVLKLLLLEVYAHHPAAAQANINEYLSEPLALSFKRELYAADPDPNLLDPYVMVYTRIEKYLRAAKQLSRLALVRRCFYFKANQPLSRNIRQAEKKWQRLLLESLIAPWHWSNHDLHMLDNRAYWKSPHVILERTLLVNELTNSYRLLMELNKELTQDVAISSEELMILGRKLHAAFERKAGKIDWINPGISRDLSETDLCFIKEPSENGNGWKVLRGSQSDLTVRNVDVEPIRRSRSLLELIFWCYLNGILVTTTKVDIVGKNFLLSPVQKQQLLQSIAAWLPLPQDPIEHQQFTQPAQPQRLLMLFNLGVEPQQQLHKKGLQMLSTQSDALGYSGFKENLVVNVDMVHINSWGEVLSRHYSQDAVVNALLHYMRLMPPTKQVALPELMVRCFSSGQGSNIAQRITDLWRDIISCFYSGIYARTTRYILEVGEEYLLLQILQQQPQVFRFNNYDALLEKLAQPQSEYSPLLIDRYALRDKPLRLINSAITAQGVYLFYSVEGSVAQVTLVDEKGSFLTTLTPFHNQQSLLRPLITFIQSVIQRQRLDEGCSKVLLNLENIVVFELVGSARQQQAILELRPMVNDFSQLHFINIKAVAEVDADSGIHFTIYCNEVEFSALAYGDKLFSAVAEYIYKHRKQGERYPCYITDLDLSLCSDYIAQQTELQLSHYLKIKAEIEVKLSAALALL
jgi:adenylate cyclase, class 1